MSGVLRPTAHLRDISTPALTRLARLCALPAFWIKLRLTMTLPWRARQTRLLLAPRRADPRGLFVGICSRRNRDASPSLVL